MKVCIIGWYGTETIGDRAILAGILAFLAETYPGVSVSLGSLYPFFSERTLHEDEALWNELAGTAVPVDLFDSKKPKALRQAIGRADLLLIGGGPLMDLREMHMLAYAFRYARSRKVKTGVFGCGIGPLNCKEYRKATAGILNQADFVVFRDSQSLAEARLIMGGKAENYTAAIDPAAYCAHLFRQQIGTVESSNQISINMRSMPHEFGQQGRGSEFDAFAFDLVKKIHDENEGFQTMLVPHHYFFFGGDDRFFLNTLKYKIGDRDVRVQNSALSLRETMMTFTSSAACIGMRFHAMLLMVLLNGRCRVLNYTGDRSGKIRGFLDDFDPAGFFGASRVLPLDCGELDLGMFDDLLEDAHFEPPAELMENAFQACRTALSSVIS